MAEAAALPEAFATSWLNLCIEDGMTAGDTILIQAGASGLGIAAIQLTKELGATVMTTVGSGKKARFVRTIGADIVVNRRTDDLAAVMERHPVNLAMDCVAGPGLGANVIKMAPGGRWIVIATLGGAKTEIDMNVFFRRGLKLIGSTLRSRTSEEKAQILSGLESLFWGKFASGKIRPVIYKTLPMATGAEEAHAILGNQENIGKVVLVLRDQPFRGSHSHRQGRTGRLSKTGHAVSKAVARTSALQKLHRGL
ncbi:MAG: zinc-binding dehydrogenase [Opitutaceae bacterium]|jgi:NADPH2:quinone reductase|nr:zinc-binding dehydrogenase [Opitutaceae bacterium]